MLETPENDAETTAACANCDGFDVLSDAMGLLRIRGSILLKEDYLPPWSVSIPKADVLQRLLKLGKGTRVVDFHFVRRGHVEIGQENGQRIVLEAGEMAICFGGGTHVISQGEPAVTVPVEALLGGNNPFQPSDADWLRSTSLICGVFLMQDVELNPLFAALPNVLYCPVTQPSGHSPLSSLLDRIVWEMDRKPLGSRYVVERLLEILCVESLRTHLDAASATGQGWFSGLKDPVVGRTIALIHSSPGENWSVNRLAQSVMMSPSRFAARFSAALGESPMAYVAKWRMNVAGNFLENSQNSIAKIAGDVGYENLAAFNRAFKRHWGVPPAAWRTARQ